MILIVELSEKTKENLERNKWIRRRESKFISIDENSYIILNFDPEKIEVIERESFGKLKTRYRYIVTYEEYPNIEKILETNWYTSFQIDKYLSQGYKILKIQRIGNSIETRYTISLP
jgi:hypothetical protein